jgi:hypothetical protein
MRIRLTLTGLFMLVAVTGAFGQVKTAPETRNAALRYWQAFAEMKDPPSDKATQELLEKTAGGEAAWDETKLAPILDANADALGIFQRATKLPECDWGIEYSRGPHASIAYVSRARVLARLNTLQGMREMAKGQPQAALDTWLAGIRFSDHLAKGGSLILTWIAKSALLPNLRELTTDARQGRLNSMQKKQLYAAVHALPEDGFDWGRAWETEEAAGETLFEELQRSQNPAALYESLMGATSPKDCVPPSTQQVQAYSNYMRNVAAALRLPAAKTPARLAELDGEAKDICGAVRQVIPAPQRVNDARTEVTGAREALLQALAAR